MFSSLFHEKKRKGKLGKGGTSSSPSSQPNNSSKGNNSLQHGNSDENGRGEKRNRSKRKRQNQNSPLSPPAEKKQRKREPPSEKAMALSSQLKLLSTQKRLQEALDLYWDASNDDIRDEFHACIVIDCCGRSGNIQEGERIVEELKSSNKSNSISGGINVQTKTALMKGYVHSGMIREASLLYQDMMHMKRHRDRPNVRTLNTFLRGCLWSAATTTFHKQDNDDYDTIGHSISKSKSKSKKSKSNNNNNNYEIHGGVVSSEKVWPLSSPSTESKNNRKRNTNDKHKECILEPDLSSFEYSIILLSQALRVKDAESRIKLLETKFKDDDDNDGKNSYDTAVLETLSVSYLSLARACALLKLTIKAETYASKVTSITSSILSQHDAGIGGNTKDSKKKGGKRSWRSPNPTAQNDNNSSEQHQQQSRREISNKIFREHRLHEMQSEAKTILNSCQKQKDESVNFDLPYFLTTRLLYFNGGGTTDLSATIHRSSDEQINDEHGIKYQQLLLNSLWTSFGLAEATKEAHPTIRNLPFKKHLLSDEDCHVIAKVLGFDITNILHPSGHINFSHVFSSRKNHNDYEGEKMTKNNNILTNSDGNKDSSNQPSSLSSSPSSHKRPLYLELGSGFGEWAVFQAQNNPSCDYVAVELRSDRVSQMFTKAMLNGNGRPLQNMCCIGSECGHLLHSRIQAGSISKIFINHPEPPTQTFGSNTAVLSSIADGSADEPAHMLNSETLLSAIKCLDETHGELIIVTDNWWYAKLICSTLLKLVSQHGNKIALYNKIFQSQSGIRQVETFHQNISSSSSTNDRTIILYEGKPNESIGHCKHNTKEQNGSSYFDRLWRSGAGTHAEVKKRFIVSMCRSPPQNVKGREQNDRKKYASQKKKQRTKKAKKRNPEKQRIRNEKRLLKKQQALLQHKGKD